MNQTSFDATPPTITLRGHSVTLRPYGHGINRILAQISNVENENERTTAFLIAYAAVYSLPPKEALAVVSDETAFNQAVAEADMELSIDDLKAVAEYIGGINSRKEAATVTVSDSPGETDGGETRPKT